MNLIDQINRHRNLYLDELGEINENVLRIVVSEAVASKDTEDLVIGNTTISGRRIVSDEACASYEFVFDQYIAYTVFNESYTYGDPNDPNIGLLFRTYANSLFLDFVRQATFATDDFPGKLTHYEIVCLDHIIDVAAVANPSITLIGSHAPSE